MPSKKKKNRNKSEEEGKSEEKFLNSIDANGKNWREKEHVEYIKIYTHIN